MTHILLSLKTFVFAFVFLASSLIIRPMLSDPLPVKVDDPVEISQEAALDVDTLVAESDLIVVGHIVDRPQIKENTAYQEYFRVKVLLPLRGEAKSGDLLDLAYQQVTDPEAFYLTFRNRNKEAIFFLQEKDGIYVPTGGTAGLIAVEDGQLLPSSAFSLAFDMPEDAKVLAEQILNH
ncbi:MAG TPA: hypothetical protein GXZ89_05230 [Fastidiosipila sp.]|jgi:hypothetical protein|nr:hypothetical protein [Fastidiosipila sp.]